MNNPILQIVYVAIASLVPLGFLCLLVLRQYKKLRTLRPEKSFNYGLFDLWIGCLGLTPSVMFCAYILQQNVFKDYSILAFCASVVAAQIAGLALGKLQVDFSPQSKREPLLNSAMSIVMGAIIGLPLSIPVYFVLMASIFGTPLSGVLLAFGAMVGMDSVIDFWDIASHGRDMTTANRRKLPPKKSNEKTD
jgi:hypothetical protein